MILSQLSYCCSTGGAAISDMTLSQLSCCYSTSGTYVEREHRTCAGDVEMKAVSQKKTAPAPAVQMIGSSLTDLIDQATAEHRAVVAKERCGIKSCRHLFPYSSSKVQLSAALCAGRRSCRGGKEVKPRKVER